MASAKCRTVCRALCLALFGSLLLIGSASSPADGITQSEVATTATRVATLEQAIAQEQNQSAVLDQEFLAAQGEVARLQAQLADTKQRLDVARDRVIAARERLAKDAVYAYVYDRPASGLDIVFSGTPTRALTRSQYENVAFGNVSLDVRALQSQQQKLSATSALQQTEEQQAAQAAAQMQALESANEQAAAAVTATLKEVQGTLAVQVSQYAVQQAQAEAAYATANVSDAASAAQAAADDAAVAVALNATAAAEAAAAANQAAAAAGAPSVAEGDPDAAAGGAAVAAAESQLGVPYVWGGETPGVGFDCSGLTQWAWRQAGISIPRVAADQAAAIPSVPLTQLEPGDLLFYYNLDGDHQIDHVVMYIGFGPYGNQTILQAPYTGSFVQLAPLFTEGLVGAGRP